MSPGQVRIVAVGTFEVAAGCKQDTADFPGKVDEGLFLKTAKYHDVLPIDEIDVKFSWSRMRKYCSPENRWVNLSSYERQDRV
jgi:hypothetical protein